MNKIYIYHDTINVVKVIVDEKEIVFKNTKITNLLFELASEYNNSLIIWINYELKKSINYNMFDEIFHHDLIMASYNSNKSTFFDTNIGYVERHPFVTVNFDVLYPTWQMSSDVGGIHAKIILKFKDLGYEKSSSDYFLNSIAKVSIDKGLFCYSDPRLLLKDYTNTSKKKANRYDLFKFVRQHYSISRCFLMFILILFQKRKFYIIHFFKSLLCKIRLINFDYSDIEVNSSLKSSDNPELDVIIPTLGRENLVYNILNKLKYQKVLPKNVIVIEQNPDINSVSKIKGFLDEVWPFNIELVFTHQTGACMARNLGMSKIKSEWVFLCDDDNDFESNLISDVFFNVFKYNIKALNTEYILDNEKELNLNIKQGTAFGSGNAIIHSDIIKQVAFDLKFEHGYGEDSDFGMQIRNKGFDVIYFPNLKIRHFKHPVGGFRAPKSFPWSNDIFQPKPSPTVMLYILKYFTLEQIFRYKCSLFLKTYGLNFWKLNLFLKKWNNSVYWANKL